MTAKTLTAAFSNHLPANLRSVWSERPDFEQVLLRHVSAAREAWPNLAAFDERMFVAFVAERIRDAARLKQVLEGSGWSDLYLTFACVRRDKEATSTLERTLRPKLRAALRRLRLDDAAMDDIEQAVFERLLVQKDGAPRNAEFDGSGNLVGWMRVVAIREGLQLARRYRREVPFVEALASAPGARDDPEHAYMKAHYRKEYEQAFRAAAESLRPAQRLILRQHFVQKLTADELATVYSIHRASAARRVAQARDELLANTRRELLVRLRISSEDMERILGLIQSRLDFSLRDVLKTRND
jgi:RNA polymerase sigma-70 factor (ECF subfamily)